MILLVGGEKGGTGKTTIATNLAAMRTAAGFDVLLVDSDVQGSASHWAQLRDENTVSPRVASIQKFGKGLQHEIQDLSRRYQDIIIDAGGRDSMELRAAMVTAHKMYIPVLASQFDLWTLERMHDLVQTAQGFNPGLQVQILLSRAPTHPSVNDAEEAKELIREFELFGLATSIVRDRQAYRRAAREGLVVSEYRASDAKSKQEIQQLYAEVFDV